MKILSPILFLFAINFSIAQNYTENFETTPTRIWLDSTAADSLWHIGTPQKTIFDSAYSIPNAIVTDTVSPYPDSANASFFVEFELGGVNPYVEFYHRYDTETSHAGGIVEVSLDGGHNWVALYQGLTIDGTMDTIFDDSQNDGWASVYFFEPTGDWPGMNDTLPNGKPAFQGSSTGWAHSTIQFGCMALKANQDYLIKFTFYSDSSTNYTGDGWMLDNFYIDNSGICASIEEYNVISKLFPNPASESIHLELETIQPSITVKMVNILGTAVFEKEYTHTDYIEIDKDLPPGTYQVFVLSDNEVIGQSQLIKQ